jgi:hypothetical protein
MALKAEGRLFAKATTKLGLAALWLTALPIASAVAQGAPGQISAARAAAIHKCNLLAARYPIHEWGNTQIYLYRPAWPDMANKNDWQSANAAGSIKRDYQDGKTQL